MNTTHTLWLGVAALVAGAAAVITADRLGWLSAPHTETHDHASPAATVPALTRGVSPVSLATRNDIAVVESVEPQLRSQRAPAVSCSTERQVIRFADEAVAARAGLVVVQTDQRPITRTLSCNAELTFNGDRFAHISPRASGVVHRVEKSLGDTVDAGETLAILDSADLGAAKAEYLQAIAAERLWRTHLERQTTLAESGVTSRRDLLEAETRCAEACISLARAQQRLRNLGVNPESTAPNDPSPHTHSTGSEPLNVEQVSLSADGSFLNITAPFAGVVVDRHAVLGEVVDSEHVMFSIAGCDPVTNSPMLWMMLDIFESDAAAVKIGQRVMMHLPSRPGEPVAGVIAWISPQVDPVTRTLKARADLVNPAADLRANTFGRAMITIHDREELVVVPRGAVQWEGCCNIVFVKQSETQYQPRKVKLGFETDGWCVISEGVQPGDLVVTDGSFLLKTEILKGSIGAGCCADH